MEASSKSAVFACETCGKYYSSLEHLESHRQFQHTERLLGKHRCSHCPYSSNNRSHINRHERAHTLLKDPPCAKSARRATARRKIWNLT